MPEEKTYPQLTYWQWKALSLVNEKVYISKEKAAHILYGRQTAVPRAEELLDSLWDLGLIINCGHFQQYRYMTTEKGDDYIENAIKPLQEPRFDTKQVPHSA